MAFYDLNAGAWDSNKQLFSVSSSSVSSSSTTTSSSSSSSSSSVLTTTSSSSSHSSASSTLPTSVPAVATSPSVATETPTPDNSAATTKTISIVLPAVLVSLVVLIGLLVLALLCIKKRKQKRSAAKNLTIRRADSYSSEMNFFPRKDSANSSRDQNGGAGRRDSGWSKYWSVDGETRYGDDSPTSNEKYGTAGVDSWLVPEEGRGDNDHRPVRGYSELVDSLETPVHPNFQHVVEVPPGDEAKKVWKQIDSNFAADNYAPKKDANDSQPTAQHSWMAI